MNLSIERDIEVLITDVWYSSIITSYIVPNETISNYNSISRFTKNLSYVDLAIIN